MARKRNHPKALSWRARHYVKDHVGRYCAPACGFHCKVEDYVKAEQRAKTLARRLGKGWTPDVWENLGWHYAVISPCGRIKVHPSISGGDASLAFLGERGSSGGRWSQHGATPEKAIANVIRSAKAELRKIGATLEGL